MRLLIIDADPVVGQEVALLVHQAWADADVLQARTASEGLALAGEHPDLDIVVLDLILPGSGTHAMADFGRLRPTLPILVLAASEDVADIRRILSLGARGYVPKSATGTTLLPAIRLVLDGATYVPPLVLHAPPAAAPLTPRQMEVLRLVDRKLSNKAIGQMLGVSDKTVKAHLAAIFKALQVANRGQAVAAARFAGVIK